MAYRIICGVSRNALDISSCLWSWSCHLQSCHHTYPVHTTRVVPAFSSHYLQNIKVPVEVEWLDQGGAAEALRYILSRFEKIQKHLRLICFGEEWTTCSWLKEAETSSVPSDTKWVEVASPPLLGPVPSYMMQRRLGMPLIFFIWFFIIRKFWNSCVLRTQLWGDLQRKDLWSLEHADPRRSSSHLTIYTVILQHSVGERAGISDQNCGKYAEICTFELAPVKAVVSGEAVAALSIDFLQWQKLVIWFSKSCGFHFRSHKPFWMPDPIAFLKVRNLFAAEDL